MRLRVCVHTVGQMEANPPAHFERQSLTNWAEWVLCDRRPGEMKERLKENQENKNGEAAGGCNTTGGRLCRQEIEEEKKKRE